MLGMNPRPTAPVPNRAEFETLEFPRRSSLLRGVFAGDWRSASPSGIFARGNDSHQVSDCPLQFILIAPIFALWDGPEASVAGTIETVFDIVIPNDSSSQDCNYPEAASVISKRRKFPFLRRNANGIPEPSFKRVHCFSASVYLVQKRFFADWLPVHGLWKPLGSTLLDVSCACLSTRRRGLGSLLCHPA